MAYRFHIFTSVCFSQQPSIHNGNCNLSAESLHKGHLRRGGTGCFFGVAGKGGGGGGGGFVWWGGGGGGGGGEENGFDLRIKEKN